MSARARFSRMTSVVYSSPRTKECSLKSVGAPLMAYLLTFSTANDICRLSLASRALLVDRVAFLLAKNMQLHYKNKLGYFESSNNDSIDRLAACSERSELFEVLGFLERLCSDLTVQRRTVCKTDAVSCGAGRVSILARASGVDLSGRSPRVNFRIAEVLRNETTTSVDLRVPEKRQILQISTSKSEMFILLDDGRLYSAKSHFLNMYTGLCEDFECWSPVPVAFHGICRVVRVACGYDHSLCVTTSGDCFSWGSNEEGKLGLGSAELATKDSPALINPSCMVQAGSFVDCSAGEIHSLLLDSNGIAYSCGAGDGGRLGHSDGKGRSSFAAIPFRRFEKNPKVALVEAGRAASFLLIANGDVYGCGYGKYGVLGNGNTEDVYKPTRVHIPVPVWFVRGGQEVNQTWFVDENSTVWFCGIRVNKNTGGQQMFLEPVQVPLQERCCVVDASVDTQCLLQKNLPIACAVPYSYSHVFVEDLIMTAFLKPESSSFFQGDSFDIFRRQANEAAAEVPGTDKSTRIIRRWNVVEGIQLPRYEQCLPGFAMDGVDPLTCAYIVDNAFLDNTMEALNQLRLRLPLDLKRPTCARRFFKEWAGHPTEMERHTENGWVGTALEEIFASLHLPFRVMPWFRFLEYTSGGLMAKHTDGSNTHVVDGKEVRSTHTMLLYLQNCTDGGETAVWTKREKKKTGKLQPSSVAGNRRMKFSRGVLGHTDSNAGVLERVKCIKNRLLVFPHSCPHEGCLVRLQQKICLRAELYICEQKLEAD